MRNLLIGLSLSVLALACAAAAPSGGGGEAAAETASEDDAPALVGPLDREAIEAAVPDWVGATVDAEIDSEAAVALASVRPGAEVQIALGTWCSDSKREIPRLWRALDETGGMVPFTIRYVGVDRDKEEPAALVENLDVRFVPTIVVLRDGEEVGRIVEESPDGVEHDLLALLSGEASGVLTTRDSLEPEEDDEHDEGEADPGETDQDDPGG